MSAQFWYVIYYSFVGYCLEKLFARATGSPNQVRKCFLLLPLCPVYGLAMAVTAALVPREGSFLLQMAAGGLLCTAVEYLIHLFYEEVFGVRFWDYSQAPANVRGRVCLPFSILWGILSALAVRWVQPGVEAMARAIPPAWTFAAWLVLAVDAAITAALLWRGLAPRELTLAAVLAHRPDPAPGGRGDTAE